MGDRAAHEEIERMNEAMVGFGYTDKIAGPPRITLEKAIAEHFIEFNCRRAASPALAVAAAAMKAMEAS